MTYRRNRGKKGKRLLKIALICCGVLLLWQVVAGLDLFQHDRVSLSGRTVPLLLQTDVRWAAKPYGDGTVSENGCGPTCLAMVARGLCGGGDVTPDEVASFSEANGYFDPSGGTSWSLMSQGASSFGLDGRELPLDKNSILRALKNGNPIIASVREGDFTKKGHFIVLVAVADNGEIIVNDPNSEERSRKTWAVDRLIPQIKNLWAYSA